MEGRPGLVARDVHCGGKELALQPSSLGGHASMLDRVLHTSRDLTVRTQARRDGHALFFCDLRPLPLVAESPPNVSPTLGARGPAVLSPGGDPALDRIYRANRTRGGSTSWSRPLPTASVVVPTFNRAALLPKVLQALMEQDYDGKYEILVVDDGSRDATPYVLEEWARRHPSWLRVFRQDNAGPARARNRGAVEAGGQFLAFIDDDCVAENSWLRRLERALEEAGAAAVGGAVINREETWVGRYINRERVIDHVVAPDGTVKELITCNAGVRADIFSRLGGFDEAIRVAGGEDTEFSLRLRAAGLRIVSAPTARVHHDSRVDLSGYLRMIYRHGRGRRRLGEQFPAYSLGMPHLRLLWLTWPFRSWIRRDYFRYRNAGVPASEALRYVLLRYLENIVRMAGYIRGACDA